MAEYRKIDFKITILWALLHAFEELLTLFSEIPRNRITFCNVCLQISGNTAVSLSAKITRE